MQLLRGKWQIWTASGILVLVFLFYSFPLVQNWGSQTIGLYTAFADTPQIFSNFYLMETSLKAGHPLYTNELFAPFGESLFLHGYIPLMSGLHALTGGNAFVFLNSFLLLSFALAGVGAFKLAKEFAPDGQNIGFWGPLLVAFLFTFSTFRLAQWQDHIWYVVNFVPPWYFLWFRRIFSFKPFKIQSAKALIICFLLGLVSLSLEHYATIFMIYLSLGYLLLKILPSPFPGSWKPWMKVISAALTIVLISQLVDFLKRSGVDDHHGLYWSGDIAGLFVPYGSWLYAGFFDSGVPGWTAPNPDEKMMFLGFSLILALIPAKWMYWKKGRDQSGGNLFLFAAILLMLCFPVLKVFGHSLIKLPSALLHFIPFLNNVRVPSRWILLAVLFIGLFVYRLYALHLSFKKGESLFLLLFVLLLLEYRPKPYHMFEPELNEEKIVAIRQEKAHILMPFPFGVRDGYRMIGEQDNRYMYEQTLHGKKLLGGYLSRVDSAVFNAYSGDPLCHDLFALMENPQALIAPKDYTGFFEVYHPELIDVREDYRYGAAWSLFKSAAEKNHIQLVHILPGLYRLEYP